jgi:hypothetical protein
LAYSFSAPIALITLVLLVLLAAVPPLLHPAAIITRAVTAPAAVRARARPVTLQSPPPAVAYRS